MDSEHRKRTRVSVHFEIIVIIDDVPVPTEIINLSMTGILCTSQPFFRKDSPCKLILSLTDATKVVIDSKILRVGPRETAISFISMDEESFTLLKNVVQYNAPDPDMIDREFLTDAFERMRE